MKSPRDSICLFIYCKANGLQRQNDLQEDKNTKASSVMEFQGIQNVSFIIL